MIRLYMDEDSMAGSLVRALRARGFDVLTTSEADMLGRPDESQLAFAHREGRTIVTANRADFARMHAHTLRTGGHHGGIFILLRQGQDVGFVLQRITAVAEQRGEEGFRDFLAFV